MMNTALRGAPAAELRSAWTGEGTRPHTSKYQTRLAASLQDAWVLLRTDS